MLRVAIYGASSRIAHEAARLWAARGARIVLLGRDAARLDEVARDLRVSAPEDNVRTLPLGLEDPQAVGAAVERAAAEWGGLDVALVAHGWLPEQARAQSQVADLLRAIDINATSVAVLAEAFAAVFERQRQGTLAVIGSVAGDRGRQSNYIYGAAKSFVERYCQGLRNRLHPAGVRVVLIKPGPTDTPMTRGMAGGAPAAQLKLADPAHVARDIVRGIGAGQPVVYTPAKWRLIMAIVRLIPERVFVRLKL